MHFSIDFSVFFLFNSFTGDYCMMSISYFIVFWFSWYVKCRNHPNPPVPGIVELSKPGYIQHVKKLIFRVNQTCEVFHQQNIFNCTRLPGSTSSGSRVVALAALYIFRFVLIHDWYQFVQAKIKWYYECLIHDWRLCRIKQEKKDFAT